MNKTRYVRSDFDFVHALGVNEVNCCLPSRKKIGQKSASSSRIGDGMWEARELIEDAGTRQQAVEQEQAKELLLNKSPLVAIREYQ